METLNCKYREICGGCPWGHKDYDSVMAEKAPGVVFTYMPRARVRDKVDLVWENGNLGLYKRDTREVLDLDACPMMTEPLEAWFKLYRSKRPPIKKGSVRLRVSPSGERGVWLDFANQDVKTLFDERAYLKWLSGEAIVEIGQRRKALLFKEERPKLVDPILKPWFETYGPEKPIRLFGPVGGFTQAGFAANLALVTAVIEMVKRSGVKSWLELFSGHGNFALALAAHGFQTEAVELDELAVEGMKLSSAEAGLNLTVSRGDVYLKTDHLPDWSGRGLLVDPPRAGLRQLLPKLASHPPPYLLYVSCFSEAFRADEEKLNALGFRREHLVGIDQFPFSPHSEWVALFKKISL